LRILESRGAACGLPGRKGLLAWTGDDPGTGWECIEILSPEGDLAEAAHRLYACMRRLDAASLDWIVAEPVPEDGLGKTIMDRLRKAAARA
jgi:L-threonylcarbamoyladenylate synthase